MVIRQIKKKEYSLGPNGIHRANEGFVFITQSSNYRLAEVWTKPTDEKIDISYMSFFIQPKKPNNYIFATLFSNWKGLL